MPMPMEYQRASEEFERFLAEAKERAGLATRNQTYTMVQAVLITFRAHLTVEQSILFANVLPPILRAIFVADWDVTAPVVPFGSRQELICEVKSFRRDHNFSPDTVIEEVAGAIRAVVDRREFQTCLLKLGVEAQSFWLTQSA